MTVTFLSLDKAVRGDATPRAFIERHAADGCKTVYVGRTWGGLAGHVLGCSNWDLGKYITRLEDDPPSRGAFAVLKDEYNSQDGKLRLVCWCAPWAYHERRCHARVLSELLDGTPADQLKHEYTEQFKYMQGVEREHKRLLKTKTKRPATSMQEVDAEPRAKRVVICPDSV